MKDDGHPCRLEALSPESVLICTRIELFLVPSIKGGPLVTAE
jgi:hypothetical protein